MASSLDLSDQHTAHVRGVSAILSNQCSPFGLLAGLELFQLSNPIVLTEPLQVSLCRPLDLCCAGRLTI